MPYYDDPSGRVSYDDDGIFYDDDAEEGAPGSPPLNLTLPSLGTTSMEYFDITKDRAQKTLAVWTLHTPAIRIGGTDAAAYEALINQFEPFAQARTIAQDAWDEAVRAGKTSLLKMKILGVNIPKIISGQMAANAGNPINAGIIADLADVYRVTPRFAGILGRARTLHPVWVRADAVLATMTPPMDPITRPIQGIPHTAAMFKALLDGFTDVTQGQRDKAALLDDTRRDLRGLDWHVGQTSKNWYQVVKATYDPGTPAYEALASIPVEQGTPAPDPIDLNPLEQGGDNGLNVLATYEAGGGDHATLRLIEYMIEGVDADFGHAVPIDPSGNTLGPFTVGQVVKVRTRVSNSSGTVTSAVRTITIQTPL